MSELAVSDFDRSTEWWARLLGQAPTLTDERNGFALFEVPGGRLALKHGNHTGGGAIHVEVEDLTAEMRRLGSDAEVKQSAESYRRVKLHDPDGNVVVLFEWV